MSAPARESNSILRAAQLPAPTTKHGCFDNLRKMGK
jgi:hypothetical protein